MNQWSFQPIFGSYLLVAVLGIALLVLLRIHPRFPNATPGKRRTMNVLRCLVILLVIIAMLQPAWVTTEANDQTASVVFLIDGSRSMSYPDAGGQSRWLAMKDALAEAQETMAELGERFEVNAYVFGGEALDCPLEDGLLLLPDEPEADQTDLGTSLDDAVRRQAGLQLAAVFLLSDGGQRATSPRVRMQQPAKELARRDCPLITVPFGQSRDQSQARDVAVENLPDQFTVFVRNELVVRGSVRIQGYGQQPIPVELVVEKPDGTEETIGPMPVRGNDELQQVQVELTYTPEQAGQHKIRLRVPEQPGEQISENNELTAFLNVLEGGLRILYLDGNLGWQERKFIRRALDESPDIELDLWLDTRQKKDTAVTLPALEDEDAYDVFIIGDFDDEALGWKNASKIAAAVNKKKGVMFLGGTHSFGAGGYAQSHLRPVFPVKMDRLEKQPFGSEIREDIHHQGELRFLPTKSHFVTQLARGDDSDRLWANMPPLKGANKFRDLTDQAIVLAESEQGVPLLVAGQYGRGRVLALASDSTFRWYRYGFKNEYKRFWRQAMLWLAYKDGADRTDIWVRMERRRFLAGDRAGFEVGASDNLGRELNDAEFEVTLVKPDGEKTELALTRDDDLWKGLTNELAEGGDYWLDIVAKRGDETLGETRSRFSVMDQDLELADPAANPAQLEMLALLTKEAGGKMIAPEQLPAVLEEVAQRSLVTEEEVKSLWQLSDSRRDSGLFLALIVGLLCIEWFLRKSWGLV